ncbi:endonuclease/exonuclease/phosphatase family protein [soil metagenome]
MKKRILSPALLLVALAMLAACSSADDPKPKADSPKTGTTPLTPAAPVAGEQDIFFCFWNVENLFDDKDDLRNSTDEPFDNAFAHNDDLRKLKLDHLATILSKMNGGKGPDVIALVEVETVRAGELLRDALNEKLDEKTPKYKSIAMKNLDAGRHISPCVISRLPLAQTTTKLHGYKLRILETHLIVNGHDLGILAAHWTSKIRKDDGTDGETGRRNYANVIAGVYSNMVKKNPDVDILVCGDFNDTPESDPVVKSMRAVGDREEVKKSANAEKPMMFDLMAGKDATKFGTIWYDNAPHIYDHICVSPGLLDDKGWTCAPASLMTVTNGLIRPGATRRQPWRFDDPGRNVKDADRGFSDHFPVTVKLSVSPANLPPKP